MHSRVLLAERDVGNLGHPRQLNWRRCSGAPPAHDECCPHAPASRAELLARYAESDLASGDFYPVENSSWSPTGAPVADNIVGKADEGRGHPVLREPGAVPAHAVVQQGARMAGTLPRACRLCCRTSPSRTTVVVAPRTRLLAAIRSAALMGFGVRSRIPDPAVYRSRLGGVRRNARLHQRGASGNGTATNSTVTASCRISRAASRPFTRACSSAVTVS